jgi:uncharacterized DUF497 family protein
VSNIEFAWDTRKANTNLAKHGVSFEEAQTAFFDECARLLDDRILPKTRNVLFFWDSVFARDA